MIKVAVCGISGRMGRATAEALLGADDLELTCGIDVMATGETFVGSDGTHVPLFTDLDKALDTHDVDVMVDFTHPSVVAGNIAHALSHGVNCVVGTTGLTEEQLRELYANSVNGAALFVAPNFTTGAVLMMRFAEMAARFFPDIEIIEMHHDGKADSPSGTAIQTAHRIAAAKDIESTAPGKETELPGHEGARGDLVDGIPVHSVRTSGYVAHQEVILGSPGQTLTIRHDSIDRASYMPGVLLACRKAPSLEGVVIGLDKLMED